MEPHHAIRPMKPEDAEAVYHTASNALDESPEDEERLRRRTAEEIERRIEQHKHAFRHDPGGAWVAEDGGRISGVAVAPVRERVRVLFPFALAAAPRKPGAGRH